MQASLVVAVPDTHPLPGARRLSLAPDCLRGVRHVARRTGERFYGRGHAGCPGHADGIGTGQRGGGMPHDSRVRGVQPHDPHGVFVPLEESPSDVDLRMAWRRDD